MKKINLSIWMQKYRRFLLVIGPALLIFFLMICYFLSGRYVTTTDAYVQAAQAAITVNVPGQVFKIYVHDNQEVKKGEPLFSLDDKPYKINVENAQAQLINARLQVEALKATYQQQLANVKAAQENLNYQRKEFERQKKLAAAGISSQMQLNQVTNSFSNSMQQLAAAKQQLANVLSNLNNNPNIPADNHPIVEQAQAKLDQANLNLFYTTVVAPIDGIVTKVEQLQLGDYINVGTPAFSLVSNHDIWIEANFKETDITYMRPGQKAAIVIDAYPNAKLIGHIASTSPGTGSIFSLLPPENATGNWVKVVQRVPVRISIEASNSLLKLSAGLSAKVTVDTKH